MSSDLELVEAAVALTERRISVPLEEAFAHLHGRPLRSSDFVEVRMAILRLERAGLLHTDSSLRLEPTRAGQEAVEQLRERRDVSHRMR
jgi:hypothetical protein